MIAGLAVPATSNGGHRADRAVVSWMRERRVSFRQANTRAWNVLLWFATLVTLASGLVQVKFVDWLGKTLTPHVQGFSTPTTLLLVIGSFFALHYLFASLTATPYATGPSPIYFGSGYITSKAFWVYGAILGAVFLGTLLLVGVPWMMWLGF